jgi:hypothetical protein
VNFVGSDHNAHHIRRAADRFSELGKANPQYSHGSTGHFITRKDLIGRPECNIMPFIKILIMTHRQTKTLTCLSLTCPFLKHGALSGHTSTRPSHLSPVFLNDLAMLSITVRQRNLQATVKPEAVKTKKDSTCIGDHPGYSTVIINEKSQQKYCQLRLCSNVSNS